MSVANSMRSLGWTILLMLLIKYIIGVARRQKSIGKHWEVWQTKDPPSWICRLKVRLNQGIFLVYKKLQNVSIRVSQTPAEALWNLAEPRG